MPWPARLAIEHSTPCQEGRRQPARAVAPGLRDDLYDVGFAQSAEAGEGNIAEPTWSDPLIVVAPARHPLLTYKQVPLQELLRYPLVLCHPEQCAGSRRQVERVMRTVDMEPVRVLATLLRPAAA
jgi:DNA-binding transcriptional LysR family regulator